MVFTAISGRARGLGDMEGKIQEAKVVDRPRVSLILSDIVSVVSLEHALQASETALKPYTSDLEIQIVIAASAVDEADIRRAAASNPRIRQVLVGDRREPGRAIGEALRQARLDVILLAEGGGDIDLHNLADLVPAAARGQVACGYRIDPPETTAGRFLTWSYNAAAKLLLGSPSRDTQCPLKAFPRDVLADLDPRSPSRFIHTEIPVAARRLGLEVVDVGVRQTGKRLQGWASPVELIRLWWSKAQFPAADASPSRIDRTFWLSLATLALIAGLLLLLNRRYPLLEPDEGRYAEIGREMLLSGDWVVPTLNQEAYFDKPPLFYWLVALSYRCFGLSAANARLVPLVATLLTILATFLFGRRFIGPRAGLLAGLVLASTAGFIQCGRLLIIDSLLTFWVSLAFFTAYAATRRSNLAWGWWLTSALFCGFGVLCKGPVALVLLGPVATAYAWLRRDSARLGLRHWAAYGLVIVAVAAPWFIAIMLREPDFARQFFIDHHFKRFTTAAFHQQPMWYYIPVVLIGTLPWSLLIVPVTRFYLSRSPQVGQERPRVLGWLALWAGWCYAFFSLSRGKLPPYLLPMMPALALLVGCYLDRALTAYPKRFFHLARTSIPRQGLAMLALIYCVAAGVLIHLRLIKGGFAAVLVALGLTWLVAAIFGKRRFTSVVAWSLFGLAGLGIPIIAAHKVVPVWAHQRFALRKTQEATAMLRGGTIPVVTFGREWGSIPFGVGHANMYHFTGDNRSEFHQFLSDHPSCLLVMRHDEIGMVLDHLPPGSVAVRVMDAGMAKVALLESKEARH